MRRRKRHKTLIGNPKFRRKRRKTLEGNTELAVSPRSSKSNLILKKRRKRIRKATNAGPLELLKRAQKYENSAKSDLKKILEQVTQLKVQ